VNKAANEAKDKEEKMRERETLHRGREQKP
jgi:hypothetical protein